MSIQASRYDLFVVNNTYLPADYGKTYFPQTGRFIFNVPLAMSRSYSGRRCFAVCKFLQVSDIDQPMSDAAMNAIGIQNAPYGTQSLNIQCRINFPGGYYTTSNKLGDGSVVIAHLVPAVDEAETTVDVCTNTLVYDYHTGGGGTSHPTTYVDQSGKSDMAPQGCMCTVPNGNEFEGQLIIGQTSTPLILLANGANFDNPAAEDIRPLTIVMHFWVERD